MDKDVIIIGGGLAGLSCALELHRNNLSFVLLEQDSTLGGRVKTDRRDGFLLDRGFQVLLDSYPELQSLDIVPYLDLHKFEPGAYVRREGDWHLVIDPYRRPTRALKSVFSPIGTFSDKLLVAKLRKDVLYASPEDLSRRPEMTTRQRLRSFGMSNEMLEAFFAPFFGGVFLESELATSRHKFDFLFKMFAQGSACLPAAGMQSLPEALAALLPQPSLVCSVNPVAVEEQSVRLSDGRSFRGKWIVFASHEAEKNLLDGIAQVSFHSTTCLYFSASHIPDLLNQPFLLLNGENRGLINSLCSLTAVAPSYAPAGTHLLSVTLLGNPIESDEDLTAKVHRELIQWFGTVAQTWKSVTVYRVVNALPAQPPGIGQHSYRLAPHILRCGDHVHGASINGALESGRKVARLVLEESGRVS